MTGKTTICGLFYGDHPDLARGALWSLGRTLFRGGPVQDVRLALNAVSAETEGLVSEWLERTARDYGIPGRLLISRENRFKYPVMRRMFRQPDRPLAELVMWFDDDTFWENADPSWWDDAVKAIADVGMIGQIRSFPYPESRQAYFRTRAWFDSSRPVRRNARGSTVTKFVQGAWWLIRSELLLRFDWPDPDLRHNGGDSMLGELLWHQKIPVRAFEKNLKINGGWKNGRSLSPRRGHSERDLGFAPQRPKPDHAFTLVTRDYDV